MTKAKAKLWRNNEWVEGEPMNEEEQPQKNPIADAIATLSNNAQVHRNNGWTQQDTLSFHRTKLMEKMLDQLSWSTQQAEEYSDKQRSRVITARSRFNGDEISTTQLQAAIAEAQSASLNAEILAETMAALQADYAEEHGEEYTPYNRQKHSNMPTRGAASDIPADIAAQLAAMGLEGETETVANTNGIDTPDERTA